MSGEFPLSGFRVDAKKCTGCGQCAADCPVHILYVDGGVARMKRADDGECLACQHCLAVCPTAAVSVAGRKPEDSRPVNAWDPAAVEQAIFARRSVRQFTDDPVPEAVLRKIIDVANHAPTAVNARDLHFTVVANADAMRDLRRRTCERLVEMGDRVPEDTRWIVGIAQSWLNGGADGIFRNAPHVIVVTGGKGQVHTRVDSVIALSYFELHAIGHGIGATWCGMFDSVLRVVPESREWLGIPEDREIGYAMLFGNADVRYPRSAQHGPADINFVEKLGGLR